MKTLRRTMGAAFSKQIPLGTLSARRQFRLCDLIHQILNRLLVTLLHLQARRNHNQMRLWQNSLRDFPNLFLLVFEEWGGCYLAIVSSSAGLGRGWDLYKDMRWKDERCEDGLHVRETWLMGFGQYMIEIREGGVEWGDGTLTLAVGHVH